MAAKKMEFYVNGRKIGGMLNPHFKCDITDLLKADGNVLAIRLDGSKPISGLLGCAVWLQPEIKLAPVVSLLGEWEAVMSDWSTRDKVAVPGVDRTLTDNGTLKDDKLVVKANHLVRDIDVPAEWKGKNIYIHLETPRVNSRIPGQDLPVTGLSNGLLWINGDPVLISSMCPLDEMLNVTLSIKYGQKNRIELWPRSEENLKDVLTIINNIEIGCEAD